jgi:hypothetical protein
MFIMNNGITPIHPARILLALIALATILLVNVSDAFAQHPPCLCDVVIVKVDGDVACKIGLCLKTFDGPICGTFEPGTSTKVETGCRNVSAVVVKSVCGEIGISLGDCAKSIRIAQSCCVDICFQNDGDGCPVVTITRRAQCLPCLSHDLGDLRGN